MSPVSSKNNPKKVLLLIGTRKGGLILASTPDRQEWHMSDLHFKSWNVMNMTFDRRDERMYAAVVHEVYGPSIHHSDDLGNTWKILADYLPPILSVDVAVIH